MQNPLSKECVYTKNINYKLKIYNENHFEITFSSQCFMLGKEDSCNWKNHGIGIWLKALIKKKKKPKKKI